MIIISLMQYCFCYKAIYESDIIDEVFNCLDTEGQLFEWIDIKDIDNYKILPLSNKELIVSQNISIKHIIERN